MFMYLQIKFKKKIVLGRMRRNEAPILPSGGRAECKHDTDTEIFWGVMMAARVVV